MRGMAQFVAVLGTILDLREPGAFGDAVAWLTRSRWRDRALNWLARWERELRGGRLGYSGGRPFQIPELEAEAAAIAEAAGLAQAYSRRVSYPTLCLTHDVDYLLPTIQMKLKRVVASRALKWQRGPSTFLPSLRGLLEFDAQVAGGPCPATVFVAAVAPLIEKKARLTQWLLDPAYRISDSLFDETVDLLRASKCEIGLHGSFLSIARETLGGERAALSRRLGREVRVGRQHWLHLPGDEPFQKIADAGIRIDSTVGWNGAAGFRGGMGRPFPIFLRGRQRLWQVPLVLMDGPLFDDMRLDADGAVALGKKILTEVLKRGGCVAIDWHERAADPRYRWFDAYRRIVEWAAARGFRFSGISQAIESYSLWDGTPERADERVLNL